MMCFKQLLKFYINSSIHVAFAATALTYVTYLNLNTAVNYHLLAIVFCATISGYNFIKYYGLAKSHHKQLTNRLKSIKIFTLVIFLVLIYLIQFLNTISHIYLIIIGCITFLYAAPFPFRKYIIDDQKNLRSISGLKIYIIALVWTLTTVVFPLANNLDANQTTLLLLIQRYIFIIALMLPFEIRDLQYDNIKLSTIPQLVGVKTTKIVGVALCLIYAYIGSYILNNTLPSIIITLIISSILALCIIKSTVQQSFYFCSLWVESIPIVWLLLLLLFQLIF